jgi:hypothetical protein
LGGKNLRAKKQPPYWAAGVSCWRALASSEAYGEDVGELGEGQHLLGVVGGVDENHFAAPAAEFSEERHEHANTGTIDVADFGEVDGAIGGGVAEVVDYGLQQLLGVGAADEVAAEADERMPSGRSWWWSFGKGGLRRRPGRGSRRKCRTNLENGARYGSSAGRRPWFDAVDARVAEFHHFMAFGADDVVVLR